MTREQFINEYVSADDETINLIIYMLTLSTEKQNELSKLIKDKSQNEMIQIIKEFKKGV